MCSDDDRQAEADLDRQEAAGKHHTVAIQATVSVETTVTLPGRLHTIDDLWEAVREKIEVGEIITIEEL